jgi:hypothetical protein
MSYTESKTQRFVYILNYLRIAISIATLGPVNKYA